MVGTLFKLIKRRPIPSHPPHKPKPKHPKLKKTIKGGSKPRVSSTARERAIASKAVKTSKQRFKERMDMGLPDNERQRRLSKIPGRRKQIRRKK